MFSLGRIDMVELYCFFPEEKMAFFDMVIPQGYRKDSIGTRVPAMALITDGISRRYSRIVDGRVDRIVSASGIWTPVSYNAYYNVGIDELKQRTQLIRQFGDYIIV